MGGVSASADPRVLAAAVEAARAAGEIAMTYYRGGFDVILKPDQTPVTQADREAEQIITQMLGRAFPDWGFLGEEFGQRGAAGDAMDHRSHRRDEELRAAYPDLGRADRARGARRGHGRASC